MSGRRIGGVLCLVLAILLLISGIGAVSRDPGVADPSGLGVSRAVGAFLLAVVALIVGLWLLRKPKGG